MSCAENLDYGYETKIVGIKLSPMRYFDTTTVALKSVH
jgi:hypothetical protein